MLGSFIKKQRVKRDMTQAYLASELGISRPTYVQIERGKRELTVTEAKKLAAVFDISLDDFLAGKAPRHKVTIERKKTVPSKSARLQIRVTEKNLEKFKQVLLYVLGKVGSRPNVGETVLYKLMGATYIKNHHGPTPVEFKDIVADMQEAGEIEKLRSRYFKYDQKKYLPLKRPNLKLLSGQEIQHIDWELDRLAGMTAKQISDFSHIDTPWQMAKDREKMEYEFVFYRPPETSVREYESL